MPAARGRGLSRVTDAARPAATALLDMAAPHRYGARRRWSLRKRTSSGAAALALALLVGCGSSTTSGPNEYLGPGPHTVDGVALGMTTAEVEQVLGAPSQRLGPPRREVWRFDPDTSLTLQDGKVVGVSGITLRRGDQVLARAGMDEGEVTAALGVGRIVRRSAPTGGGIITTGSTPSTVNLYYRDDAAEYDFHIYVPAGPSVRLIHANPLPEVAPAPAPRSAGGPTPGRSGSTSSSKVGARELALIALCGLLLVADGVLDLGIFGGRRRSGSSRKRGAATRLLVVLIGGLCLLSSGAALVLEALGLR